MKILYVAPYHVSGTLDLMQEEHRKRGNECRVVTLFKSPNSYAEDICLNLPLQPTKNSPLIPGRRILHRLTRGPLADETPIVERPPFWKSPSPIASVFFAIRDKIIEPYIKKAFEKYDLDSFDIIWLDQGAEFFRDARVVKRWAKDGKKKLIGYYHGSDMRNRGIYPQVDEHLDLRLTCEVDLMTMDNRLEYLFLPFRTDEVKLAKPSEKKIKIVHAARVRAFKGTERIIEVVDKLKNKYPVELVLIENKSHEEAMRLKQNCDIAVDQIADTGGWGYGMSSVEYLSMGIPTCTSMVKEMVDFLPDHPFVAVTPDNLETNLIRLIEDEDFRLKKGREGREWVVKHHALESVIDSLYEYFEREGWL